MTVRVWTELYRSAFQPLPDAISKICRFLVAFWSLKTVLGWASFHEDLKIGDLNIKWPDAVMTDLDDSSAFYRSVRSSSSKYFIGSLRQQAYELLWSKLAPAVGSNMELRRSQRSVAITSLGLCSIKAEFEIQIVSSLALNWPFCLSSEVIAKVIGGLLTGMSFQIFEIPSHKGWFHVVRIFTILFPASFLPLCCYIVFQSCDLFSHYHIQREMISLIWWIQHWCFQFQVMAKIIRVRSSQRCLLAPESTLHVYCLIGFGNFCKYVVE